MRSFLSVFAFVIALALPGNPAAACSCFGSSPFFEAAPKGDLVIVGVVTSYHENTMQVQIEQVLKGQEDRQTITVWGDNGMQCRPYVTYFPLTTKWVFSLFRAKEQSLDDDLKGLEHPLPISAAGPPHYGLSICGKYWLLVQGDEAAGQINGEQDEIVPISDIARWFAEGAKGPLGRKS